MLKIPHYWGVKLVQLIAWCHQETSHCPNQCWTRGPFHERFSIVIQIQWKIGLSVTPSLGTISLQNFAHATTVQLSCHVQNFIVFTLTQIWWEQNEISIKLQLLLIICLWNGPQNYVTIRRHYATMWPGGTIWRHRTQSILVQLIGCWPMAPTHYLKYWFIACKILWHSFEVLFLHTGEWTVMWDYLIIAHLCKLSCSESSSANSSNFCV